MLLKKRKGGLCKILTTNYLTKNIFLGNLGTITTFARLKPTNTY